MTVTHVSTENEQILEAIVNSGRFEDKHEAITEALRLLNDKTTPENGQVLSLELWREKFRQHLATTPTTTATFVDDSRESIYEGRGE